jgi:Flp pilus assembly protein TadG
LSESVDRIGAGLVPSGSSPALSSGVELKILKRGNDEGAAAVEAAIVFPVLIMMIFGLLGLGLVLSAYQAVNHAAYEGARYAALGQTAPEVQERVYEVMDSVTSSGLVDVDPPEPTGCVDGQAEVTVTATVHAVVLELPIEAKGVEKCA